jgi:hypothetical protein
LASERPSLHAGQSDDLCACGVRCWRVGGEAGCGSVMDPNPASTPEWNEEPEGPRWLTLDDVDFRGGGLMGKR